jgi:hypothetical protein
MLTMKTIIAFVKMIITTSSASGFFCQSAHKRMYRVCVLLITHQTLRQKCSCAADFLHNRKIPIKSNGIQQARRD